MRGDLPRVTELLLIRKSGILNILAREGPFSPPHSCSPSGSPVKRRFCTPLVGMVGGRGIQGVEEEKTAASGHFDATLPEILEPGDVRIGLGLWAPNSQSRQFIWYLSKYNVRKLYNLNHRLYFLIMLYLCYNKSQ